MGYTVQWAILIMMIGYSCVTMTPSSNLCTGSKICAYDSSNRFVGFVTNHLKDNSQTEVITTKNYTLYFDEKSHEIDQTYHKYRLLSNGWPIVTRVTKLGVYLPDNEEITQKGVFSFTTRIEGGIDTPLEVCYDPQALPIDPTLQFKELSRIGEDPTYKPLYQFEDQNQPVNSGEYIPLTSCNEKDSGAPSSFKAPITIKNAQDIPYIGDVKDSQCQKGVSSCLL